MTRLFLRFYIGVVLILVAAWLIQSYVFRQRSEAQNIRVVENALSGGVRLARNRLNDAGHEGFDEAFAQLQAEFAYPCQRIRLDADWLPSDSRQRLLDGEVVLLGDHIGIALWPKDRRPTVSPSQPSLADELKLPIDSAENRSEPPSREPRRERNAESSGPNDGLLFGPLPQFVGPTQAEVTFGYGAVFFLAAFAIAVLLRPVASQFRAVEQTATAIADGDLSARIEIPGKSNDLALVQAFNSMADRTESLLLSQRELLQAVSHELRTPLARIRFAADLVETASTDEERRMRLDSIDSATVKLDGLVGELLTYVRLESDALDTTPETIELGKLVDQAIDTHSPLNPQVKFQRANAGIPLLIEAHPTSLARAVENLVSNAGRHAKSRVEVSAHIDEHSAVIHVDDDGVGIAEEDRGKVLEPFVRLDNTDQRGSGLGLALVSRIIRQHNGDVHVGRSPLGGARFTLTIPVHESRGSHSPISRYRPETTSDAANDNLS